MTWSEINKIKMCEQNVQSLSVERCKWLTMCISIEWFIVNIHKAAVATAVVVAFFFLPFSVQIPVKTTLNGWTSHEHINWTPAHACMWKLLRHSKMHWSVRASVFAGGCSSEKSYYSMAPQGAWRTIRNYNFRFRVKIDVKTGQVREDEN